jgi:hypothetical protein
MLCKLLIVGAAASTLMIPTALSAQVLLVPDAAIGVMGRPVIGQRYYGGIWYGTGRRFWRGRWHSYGVGPCWRPSPIGFVWICEVSVSGPPR